MNNEVQISRKLQISSTLTRFIEFFLLRDLKLLKITDDEKLRENTQRISRRKN